MKIYPTGDHYIPGVPAVEQDVDRATARRLLAWTPPAFTAEPPGEPASPQPEAADAAPEPPEE